VGSSKLFFFQHHRTYDAGIVDALETVLRKTRQLGCATWGRARERRSKWRVKDSSTRDGPCQVLEEKFVAEGFGTERIDLMYNDFVIVGPANDPAGIKGMKTPGKH